MAVALALVLITGGYALDATSAHSVTRSGPAELDPDFGTGGLQSLTLEVSVSVEAVTLDSEGRLLVVGAAGTGDEDPPDSGWLVARLLPDGAFDPTFDGDGWRIDRNYPCSGSTCSLGGGAFAVVSMADGKIVVGGYDGSAYALARYTSAGAIDTTFADDGFYIGPFNEGLVTEIRALVEGPFGSVIGLAQASGISDPSFAQYGLMRLTAEGQPDDGFGDHGWYYEPHMPAQAFGLVRQGSGRLVVAGYHDYGDSPGSTSQVMVARYWANGVARDDTFGENGLRLFHYGLPGTFDTAYGLALEADEHLVVAGMHNAGLGVARLTPGGELDLDFGTLGRVPVEPPSLDDSYAAYAVAVLPQGRIQTVGTLGYGTGSTSILSFRFMADGSFDTGFGENGRMVTNFGLADWNEAIAAAVDSSGRLVAGGFWQSTGPVRGAVIRYAAPALPTETPTLTSTASPTETESPTPTATLTEPASATPSATPTASPTDSPSPSPGIETPVLTASPTPLMLAVSGQVTLERRDSNAGAQVCAAGTCVETDTAGNYALAAPAGVTISVSHASYLMTERLLPEDPPDAAVTLPPVTLLAGDLDQDGKIDIVDAVMIGQRFGLRRLGGAGANWLEACDITSDGLVDVRDMVAVQYNFLLEAPGPWP